MATPQRSASGWSASYDPETQTMTIWFPNGRSYDYDGVPPDVYEGFQAADSKGSYYNARIRNIYG